MTPFDFVLDVLHGYTLHYKKSELSLCFLWTDLVERVQKPWNTKARRGGVELKTSTPSMVKLLMVSFRNKITI